ncbi:YqeG family HAD IIIA-type phosphatase [Latilactobacillus fuchuensis]|uniref:YqeG family HAD IIIA-type phosphatase n=1 Tax=Latilactobacillus fuchuensis TaxID=164393 RepID=UPI0020C81EE3|nr:YqeG family HAD IIIA-type phosphatase [Latilactobacillus fuchuensis]MCP8857804.1 YqeG family HAD IIIA-type phosphatase [Latilactobacillus fuchuensis]
MLNNFKPTWMVNAIYDLTPAQLQAHGIKAVLTDLDNTLIAWNNPNGTPQLKVWLAQLEAAGIPVMVVSNNSHQRVERAVAPFNLPFISRANKPLAGGITKAHQQLGLSRHEVVMVGDQLITDMHAGNVAGVRTILVKPIIDSDAWNTSINRFFEKYMMQQLLKKHTDLTWREDLND